jgi:aspartate/methionine/tyrosine aminotransferase
LICTVATPSPPYAKPFPQTNGSTELREVIALQYAGATADNVFVSVGAAEANYLVMNALLEAGDECCIVLPNYMQVYGIARNLGVTIREVHLSERDDWRLDTRALAEAVGPKTKLIAVCNPNNPTGRILSTEEMDSIVAEAERVGAWLLADEVYRGAERVQDEETASFFGRYERALCQGSMSKAYGLPGLRLGWTVGPPALLERLGRRHEYTTICSSMLSNHLARIALSPAVRPRILARTRAHIRSGHERLVAWAEDSDDIRLFSTDAAAIAFCRYTADINSTELVERMRKEQSVLVVPGDHFGLDGCLRISFGLPHDYVDEGLRRIGKTLAELRS